MEMIVVRSAIILKPQQLMVVLISFCIQIFVQTFAHAHEGFVETINYRNLLQLFFVQILQ